jgi:hypothetical protein
MLVLFPEVVVRHTSFTTDPTLFIETVTSAVQLMWPEKKNFPDPSRVVTLSYLFSVRADQRMGSITKQISGLQERQTFIYLHMKGIISVSWSHNYSKQHTNVNMYQFNSQTKISLL